MPGADTRNAALLPLHIFEPRYRTMLADCVATSRCMAMAFVLVDGDRVDVEGDPKIARVAGAGLVVHHAALADGRSNIVLQGRARVWLDELPFTPPYRRARARILDESETPVSAADRSGLLAVATAFAAAVHQTEFAVPSGIGPGAAADLCAHQLIVDPTARQHVLEELDVVARVRLVAATLAEQMGRVNHEGGRARVARRRPLKWHREDAGRPEYPSVSRRGERVGDAAIPLRRPR